MNKDDMQEKSQSLEDIFFSKENQKRIEQHRALQKMEETQAALAKVSGIRNDAILKKLVELNIRPETLVTLTLVPLVEIAWADGSVDQREKDAILQAVSQSKQALGSMDRELLEQWLNQRPPPQLLDAWMHYMRGLCEQLSREEVATLKAEFVKQAQAIANAGGGFLYRIWKSSKSTGDLIHKLGSAFVTGEV